MGDNVKSTTIGTGRMDAQRMGSIGLSGPLAPTRAMEREPSLFIPSKWEVAIVRVGHQRLARPRPLPPFSLDLPNGRSLPGRLLHLYRGATFILGRDPEPREDSEKDDQHVCVHVRRSGAADEKVSSAMLSIVRSAGETGESVFALNGHVLGGQKRKAPKLYPFVEGPDGTLQKELDGPRVSQELLPGSQIYFGYRFRGVQDAKIFDSADERLVHDEGLVDAHPEFALDALPSIARFGDRTVRLDLSGSSAGNVEVVAPEAEQPALTKSLEGSGGHALVLDVDRVAHRLMTHGRYALFLGSDREALGRAAADQEVSADFVVVSMPDVQPAHAVVMVQPV